MIFKILIGILPFIMMFSILKENLGSLVLFLIGSIFVIKNKDKIKENIYFYLLGIMSLLILLSQLIVSPYIESISGVFLFFNIPLYYLIYRYLIEENKNEILKYIVLSITASSLFYIVYHGIYKGVRIFGNIGYVNSYALLILVGLYLNEIREEDKYNNIIESILFLALLFTGSRTTIILSLLYIIYKLYVRHRDKNIKFILSLEAIGFATILYIVMDRFKIYSILVVPILLIIYYFIKEIKFRDKLYYLLGIALVLLFFISNSNTINRLKNISLYTGTLQERFVYYEDSLKEILANPLGNGINMFQYKQFDAATAFYDAKYIHNSYLQIAYDGGIINGIIFISVVIIGLIIIFKSKGNSRNYLLLAYITIMIHSVLDFDFSFSTMTILLMFLVVLAENNIEVFNRNNIKNNRVDKKINKGNKNTKSNKENNKIKGKAKDKSLHNEKYNLENRDYRNLNDNNKDLANNKNIIINKSSSIKVHKSIYIVLATIAIYFIIYEGSIVLGKYLIDVNSNLSDKILSFSNSISFKRDYRGYFYKAQVKKNQYDISKDKEHLKEGIELLETSKEINPYDPMVIWNLSYLYEVLGDEEKALTYGEEVIDRERFYPEAYIKQYDYLIKLYGKTSDEKYEDKIKDLEATYYKNYGELNKRAKYMKNQLQEDFEDIRNKNIYF